MTDDLVPRAPRQVSVRAVRVVSVVAVAVVVGFWVWQLALGGGPGPVSALGAVVVVALGTAARTLWVWAAAPRLTDAHRRSVAASVCGPDRRVLSRALRRGDPPPARLRPWARPYALSLQPLRVTGSCLLLMGSMSAVSTVSSAGPTGWVVVGAVSAALCGVGGAALLRWVQRVELNAFEYGETAASSGPTSVRS